MCGILGLFNPTGLDADAASFSDGMERLRRRGPDDSGEWQDQLVRLGHRRLSIVDVSPAGHQPMMSSDNRYVIVFNGEIYNHREIRPNLRPPNGWKGHSDTETLLEAYRAWGPACLQSINGMFAFAIWDRQERSLFLARDRMGVKPLYYAQRGDNFSFGSRPGALTQLLGVSDLEIDYDALRAFLELGYVPAPLAFHRQMRKLPPAHFMLVNAKGMRVVRYWDFRSIAPDPSMRTRSEADLIDELDQLIRASVKARLMSDVPLGAFLSGGVDSAMVVAAMKSAGVERPRTFTIGFNEQQFDEGPAAAETAAHLNVEHIHETLDVNSLIDLLPIYVDEYDEPFADSSAFPTMAVAKLARQHVTVALSGDGADEIFGGYHYYPLIERIGAATRWRAPIKKLIAQFAAALPLHRAKLLAGAMRCDDTVSAFNYLRGVAKDYPPILSADISAATTGSENHFAQFAAGFPTDLSAAETAMRLDAGLTLPNLFLQKVDVATMAFSLEARCPMTDFALVEWAMRLPNEYKVRNGETKYLLKKVLCRYLPAHQVYRKKMGFGVPIARWLRGPLRSWASDLIHDESLMSKLPVEKAVVRSLLAQHLSGRRETHPLLWSVVMLLCFTDRFSARPAPAVSYRAVA